MNVYLARRRHGGTLAGVTWFKTVVTVLLLTLWLPATSHALLEEVEWIHTSHGDFHGDSDADNHDNHDAADGLCRLASPGVQVPQPELFGGRWSFSVDFSPTLAALFAAELALPNGPNFPGVAPPELSPTWQFSFRASLPPRAPSLTS